MRTRIALEETRPTEARAERATAPARPKRIAPPRRAALWLGIWLAAGLGAGAGALIYASLTGQAWIMPTAISVAAISVAGPILVAGWLIGRALRRGAGALGLLFALGMLAAGVGMAASLAAVSAIGWSAMAASALALALIVRFSARRGARARRSANATRSAK
ncbi:MULTISPECIES: hypothetical protein [unclassified Microbacterium]|uniref:hypothetical protein n=1 Tax=Microbacterium TaxID=33882 RepID=UPI003BA08B71